MVHLKKISKLTHLDLSNDAYVMFVCVCVCVWGGEGGGYVCVCVCVRVHTCICVSVSVCVCFLIFLIKAYVVGGDLNCIDKSMQFRWVFYKVHWL